MYSIDNNNLVIKFDVFDNYSSYSRVLKSLNFIDNYQILMKKKLIINLDGFIILDFIDNLSLLYRTISNFQNTLNKINLNPSDIDSRNMLILYHKRYDKYLIFGLNFKKNGSSLLDIFTKKLNIDFETFSKNLQIMYFLDNINDEIENKLSIDMYRYSISVVANKHPKNKFLPLVVMRNKFSRYLSNVLYFILFNKNEIEKLDYIIISKNGYNSKLIDLDYILNVNNYEIIGKKDNSGINGEHNLNIIRDLFNKNETGIKDLDIDSFYKSFDYIIFNSSFLLNIINHLQERDIIDLSIICSYFNQF